MPISFALCSLHSLRAFTFSDTLSPIRFLVVLGNDGSSFSGRFVDSSIFFRMERPNIFICLGLNPFIRPRSLSVFGLLSAISMIGSFPRILKWGRSLRMAIVFLNCKIDSSTARPLGSSILALLNLRKSGLPFGGVGRTLLRSSHSSSTQKSLPLTRSSFFSILLRERR